MKNLNDVISNVDDILNSAKRGNFDEALLKTKAYAEIATKKSAERLEVSKKKIELLDAKTKLTKAYEKFGKLQFDAYEGNQVNSDEHNACVEEIVFLKSRVDFITEEIQAIRNAFNSTDNITVPNTDDITVE